MPKKTKAEVEDLKRRMLDAHAEIMKILKKYKFNTMQANLLLNRIGAAIREAQAEKGMKE